MKRFSFSFAALLLAAMAMFSSCFTDDKDDEEDEIKNDQSFYFLHASRHASAQGAFEDMPDWAVHQNVFAK